MIAIRTLPRTRICIKTGLDIDEELPNAARKLHKRIDTIRGTYQENKDKFVKTKIYSGAICQTRTSHADERNLIGDSSATVQKMSKRDLPAAEERTIRKPKGSGTTIWENGSNIATEETTVYVEVLDMFITVQFWEDSPTVELVPFFSPRVEVNTLTHTDQKWNNHKLQIGNLCTDSRT